MVKIGNLILGDRKYKVREIAQRVSISEESYSPSTRRIYLLLNIRDHGIVDIGDYTQRTSSVESKD